MEHLQTFDRDADLAGPCPKCGFNDEDESGLQTFGARFMPEVPYSGVGERMEVYCRFCGYSFHRLPRSGE